MCKVNYFWNNNVEVILHVKDTYYKDATKKRLKEWQMFDIN